ncbi:MAG: hypothetical protein V3R99_05765, partial [Thermoguttaceae bacterium]
MFRGLFLLAGGLVVLSAGSAHAENAILEQMYGSGVHAYFSQDYVKSHEYLTTAIDGGTKDPRCYFFRGLVYLKLGRSDEAWTDYATGARLESLDSNRFYNVGKALERVQGSARVELEQRRMAARLAALKQSDDIRQQRYEQIEQEQGRVLRLPANTPLPEPVEDAPFAEPAESTPFAEPATQSEPPPAAEPASVENPGKVFDALGKSLGKAFSDLADDSAAATAEDEPFGTPAAEPAADEPFGAPAAEPAAPAAGDPFGTPAAEPAAPAAGDPFGTPATA